MDLIRRELKSYLDQIPGAFLVDLYREAVDKTGRLRFTAEVESPGALMQEHSQ